MANTRNESPYHIDSRRTSHCRKARDSFYFRGWSPPAFTSVPCILPKYGQTLNPARSLSPACTLSTSRRATAATLVHSSSVIPPTPGCCSSQQRVLVLFKWHYCRSPPERVQNGVWKTTSSGVSLSHSECRAVRLVPSSEPVGVGEGEARHATVLLLGL